MTARVHWHILGAGAMGCLWATALREAGHAVTLILRDGHTDCVQLQRDGVQHTVTVDSTTATGAGGITHLLVTTKATQTLDALAGVRHALLPGATVVLLQNGMGQQQAVADALPGCRLYAGLSTEGVWQRAPFAVVHAGRGLTRFGAWPPAPPQAAGLMQAFSGIDLAVQWEDDILPALWQKLAVNCAINPLAALYRCRNGELLDHGPHQQHLQRLCAEISQVLAACGIRLPGDEDCYAVAVRVATQTAANRSSMLQDVLAGRHTEIAMLNGFLLDTAARHGLDLPENRAVTAAVLDLVPHNHPHRT